MRGTTNAQAVSGVKGSNESTYRHGDISLTPQNIGVFDAVYPVGSVYININSVNPGNLFGGTWVQIESGFLFASTNGTANFFALKSDNDISRNSVPVYMWKRTA